MSEEPLNRVAPSDEYEATAVAEGQRLRHRDKHVARGAVLALVPMALIALLATVAIALGAEPATGPAGALVPFAWFLGTVYLGLTRAVVRTAVTDTHVEVHWGPKGMTVPLEAITEVTVNAAAKGPLRFGFDLWSANGSVTLRWKEQQKDRSFMFPAGDPEALVANVRSAISAHAGATGATGVRANIAVDTGAQQPVDESASAAQEQAKRAR
jgi:hypothetical protein